MVGTKKMLLVEDDIPYAKFLIDSFSAYEPEIDIFHVKMPRMSGHELLAKVRDDPSLSSVPFCLYSSLSGEKEAGQVSGVPPDLQLPKPSNFGQVLTLVGSLRSLWDPGSEVARAMAPATVH